MMTNLLFALLLAVSNLVIHIGDTTMVDGSTRGYDLDELKSEHDDFVAFELDGQKYLITDRATIQRVERILEPQHEIGRRQGELGRRQGALGREQGRIGREQGRIGREQGRAARDRDDSRMEALEARQRELAAEQNELAGKQRELAAQQRELARRMDAVTREVERELDRALADAVRRGIAKRF